MRNRRRTRDDDAPASVSVEIQPYWHQQELIDSPALWTYLSTGYNGGKTYAGACALVVAVTENPGGSSLIAAPTGNMIQDPVLLTLREVRAADRRGTAVAPRAHMVERPRDPLRVGRPPALTRGQEGPRGVGR